MQDDQGSPPQPPEGSVAPQNPPQPPVDNLRTAEVQPGYTQPVAVPQSEQLETTTQPTVEQTPPQAQVSGLPTDAPQPMTPSQAGEAALNQPKSKKGVLLGAGGAALVVVLMLAFYLLAYLPNTPENVWRRGVASIGVGLEELFEDEVVQPSQATEFSGEFNIEKPTVASASYSGSAGLSGDGEIVIDAEWDSYKPKFELFASTLKQEYPQVYFRMDGIKEIVDGFAGPGAFSQITNGMKVENTWWLLDYEELLSSGLVSQSEIDDLVAESDPDAQVSTEDYIALMKAAIEASNEYLFTADTEMMVLQRVEDLGTEEYEGVESNKYLTEVNKDNLKAYIKMLRDKVDATGVFQKIDPEFSFSEELSDEDIDRSVDDMDLSGVRIEAWVGLNNRVLRNVRFIPTDAAEGESGYVDVSLLLDDTNLDLIPLRVKVVYEDDESASNFEANWITDVANNSTELNWLLDIVDSSAYGSDFKMDMSLSMRGLAEEPAYEIPTPSRSVIELVEGVYGQAQGVLGITDSLLDF